MYGGSVSSITESKSLALKVPAKNGFSYIVVPFSNLSDSVSKYGYSSNISLK